MFVNCILYTNHCCNPVNLGSRYSGGFVEDVITVIKNLYEMGKLPDARS